MSQQLATVEATAVAAPRKPTGIRVVNDVIAVLDTARFEHMQRIATIMARSNLIPHSLCYEKGDNDQLVPLPIETVTANCFLIVNQAVRWNMDPFAVAQCVSVVHGKLCYEGKLIAAVIQGRVGVDLEYEMEGQGDAMKVVVTGALGGKPILDSKGRPKAINGTVGEWKTTSSGSPWSARGGHTRMLRYRGAREWCRVYEPGLMLGVYGDDELEDLRNARAAHAAEDGGGPPVPNLDTTHGEPEGEAEARAESMPRRSQDVDDGGGPPEPDPGFPGDKPMSTDDLDIPTYLRRAAEPSREDDWLDQLETEFAACKTMEELSETQRGVMSPWDGQVSVETWNNACDLMDKHVQRLQGVG